MSTNEIMPKLKDFLCENLGIDADVLEFDTQLFGDGEIGLLKNLLKIGMGRRYYFRQILVLRYMEKLLSILKSLLRIIRS